MAGAWTWTLQRPLPTPTILRSCDSASPRGRRAEHRPLPVFPSLSFLPQSYVSRPPSRPSLHLFPPSRRLLATPGTRRQLRCRAGLGPPVPGQGSGRCRRCHERPAAPVSVAGAGGFWGSAPCRPLGSANGDRVGASSGAPCSPPGAGAEGGSGCPSCLQTPRGTPRSPFG